MAISTDLKGGHKAQPQRTYRSSNRRGFAFLIEALVVLAFLMGCHAVFVKLFATAQLEGLAANRLSQAIVAATNRAEEFSANPENASDLTTEDGLRITCDVKTDPYDAGTLFKATITVLDERDGNAELFRLDTSRYVSGLKAGDES